MMLANVPFSMRLVISAIKFYAGTFTGFSYIPNGFKSNPTVEYCIKTTTIVRYTFPKQYHSYAGIICSMLLLSKLCWDACM